MSKRTRVSRWFQYLYFLRFSLLAWSFLPVLCLLDYLKLSATITRGIVTMDSRVGHMGLTDSTQVAPEIYSYLDFSLGRFSNLESLICHRPDQGEASVTGNGCSIYGSQYTFDSRKRLYRVDIEGLLKIPDTLFYVGLNANIGQKQVMAEKLDPNFAAPNDLRFLFGTKFDIAQLFAKLGVKQQ